MPHLPISAVPDKPIALSGGGYRFVVQLVTCQGQPATHPNIETPTQVFTVPSAAQPLLFEIGYGTYTLDNLKFRVHSDNQNSGCFLDSQCLNGYAIDCPLLGITLGGGNVECMTGDCIEDWQPAGALFHKGGSTDTPYCQAGPELWGISKLAADRFRVDFHANGVDYIVLDISDEIGTLVERYNTPKLTGPNFVAQLITPLTTGVSYLFSLRGRDCVPRDPSKSRLLFTIPDISVEPCDATWSSVDSALYCSGGTTPSRPACYDGPNPLSVTKQSNLVYVVSYHANRMNDYTPKGIAWKFLNSSGSIVASGSTGELSTSSFTITLPTPLPIGNYTVKLDGAGCDHQNPSLSVLGFTVEDTPPPVISYPLFLYEAVLPSRVISNITPVLSIHELPSDWNVGWRGFNGQLFDHVDVEMWDTTSGAEVAIPSNYLFHADVPPTTEQLNPSLFPGNSTFPPGLHRPNSTFRVRVTYSYHGVVLGSQEARFGFGGGQDQSAPNPGIPYSETKNGVRVDAIDSIAARVVVLENGNVRLIAPLTRLSFNGANVCRLFLYDGQHNRLLSAEREALLSSNGLSYPDGEHGLMAIYVNAPLDNYDSVENNLYGLFGDPSTYASNSARKDMIFFTVGASGDEPTPPTVPTFNSRVTQPYCDGFSLVGAQLTLTNIVGATRYRISYTPTYVEQGNCTASDGVITGNLVNIPLIPGASGTSRSFTVRVYANDSCDNYADTSGVIYAQNCAAPEITHLNLDMSTLIDSSARCGEYQNYPIVYDIYAKIIAPGTTFDGATARIGSAPGNSFPVGLSPENSILMAGYNSSCGGGVPVGQPANSIFYRFVVNLNQVYAQYPQLNGLTVEMWGERIKNTGAGARDTLWFTQNTFTKVRTISIAPYNGIYFSRDPLYTGVATQRPYQTYNGAVGGVRKLGTFTFNRQSQVLSFTAGA